MPCRSTTGLALTPVCSTTFTRTGRSELARSLNAGRLPAGYIALAEQQTGGPIPDVLTLSRRPTDSGTSQPAGLAVATAPPQARFIVEVEEDAYARRANRICIHHRHGEVVAVMEIVSPGDKTSSSAQDRSSARHPT